MSDQPTQPFWTAKPRPTRPAQHAQLGWRDRAETVLNRLEDAYNALWDFMPAIAAAAFLTWLIATFHR